MENKTAIVIGASHAASQLVLSLRKEGWAGSILVISDEPYLPYHRPPLSKDYLCGDKEAASLLIRPEAIYEKEAIGFLLNTRVEAIDRENQRITLSRGDTLKYDKLALCTGARVRRLQIPGAELGGVHYLRDLSDAEAIKKKITPGGKAVIIGGGYIGLETAALLRKTGMDVCLVETMDRVLQRVTSAEISAFYHRIHTEQGVDIKTAVSVLAIEGKDDRVESVVCDTGERLAADIVIIGIGVIPNTELAERSGLAVENGILVDEFARTSDPDIVAAGDCTAHPNAFYGRHIRLESVPNATEQSKTAAASICGTELAYRALPWFWSDQYHLKLQIAGLNQGFDEVAIRGDIETTDSFVVWYLKEGSVIAADCVNRPVEFMLAKRLLLSAKSLPIADLINEDIPAKTMLAALR